MEKDAQIEQLAQMVQRGFQGVEKRFDAMEQRFDALEEQLEHGFAEVNRRIDNIIRPQLDEHGHRISGSRSASDDLTTNRPGGG